MSDLSGLPSVQGNPGPTLSIWQDRPPPVGLDQTPAIVHPKFRMREGADVSSPLTTRLNRLYDLMPEGARANLEIVEGRSGGAVGATGNLATGGRPATGELHPPTTPYEGPAPPKPPVSGQNMDLLAPGAADAGTRLAVPTGSVKLEGEALDWARKNAAKVGLTITADGRASLSEEARRADAVTGGKRALSDEEAADLFKNTPVAGTEGSRTGVSADLAGLLGASEEAAMGAGGIVGAEPGGVQAEGEQNAALTAGVLKGAVGVPLGTAELLLPESAMEPVRRQYRDLVSRFDEVGEKYPQADFVGRLAGATIAIMGSSGALGAAKVGQFIPKAVQTAWESLGVLGRGAVTGAAVGGTEFHPEGAPGAVRRGAETALGATFGLLGGVIAKGAGWAADNLANTTLAGKFFPVLQETAAGLTRNSEGPLADTLEHYRKMEQAASTRYNLRNTAGKGFEGFPSGVGPEGEAEAGFSQAIEASLEESRAKGIETRRTVEGVASRVKDVLGLSKEEGRLGEYRAQVSQYEKAAAAAAAAEDKLVGGLGGAAKEQTLTQLRLKGGVPARPEPPEPFQAEPVTPEAYAQARTAVNAALRRTRDAAARTQLNMLRNSLDDVAKGTAAEYGMGASEFLRKANAANKFFEENVAPLRNFFGGKTATQVAGRAGVPLDGMTPAGFYSKIAGVIEGDDLTAIRDVSKALGPKARDNLKMIAASRAIEAGTEGRQATTSAYSYIQKHQDALRELLGRDEYTNLVGMGKIADSMIHKIRTGDKKAIFDYSHSMGPAFAFYQLIEHHSVPKFLGTLAALPAYHLVLNVLQKVHVGAAMTPMVRRAATLKPGSAELEELVRAIERRVRAAAVPAERASRP